MPASAISEEQMARLGDWAFQWGVDGDDYQSFKVRRLASNGLGVIEATTWEKLNEYQREKLEYERYYRGVAVYLTMCLEEYAADIDAAIRDRVLKLREVFLAPSRSRLWSAERDDDCPWEEEVTTLMAFLRPLSHNE